MGRSLARLGLVFGRLSLRLFFIFFHFHPLHRAESAAFDFYFQSTLVANTFPYGKEKKKKKLMMMMMMMMKRKKKKEKEKKKKKKKKSIVDGGQVCAR